MFSWLIYIDSVVNAFILIALAMVLSHSNLNASFSFIIFFVEQENLTLDFCPMQVGSIRL